MVLGIIIGVVGLKTFKLISFEYNDAMFKFAAIVFSNVVVRNYFLRFINRRQRGTLYDPDND